MAWTNNRLTVLGSRAQMRRFQESNWDRRLRVRYCELLENSPRRFTCQFESEHPPLASLTRLTHRWPRLTLLLVYEVEAQRLAGLAKAKAGQLEYWQTNY